MTRTLSGMFSRRCLVSRYLDRCKLFSFSTHTSLQTLELQLLLSNPVKRSRRKAVSECSLLKFLLSRFVPWHCIQLSLQDAPGDALDFALTPSKGSFSFCSRSYSEELVPKKAKHEEKALEAPAQLEKPKNPRYQEMKRRGPSHDMVVASLGRREKPQNFTEVPR